MEIWKLLTGVVIFLLGTGFMEESLRRVTGRKLKLFIKRHAGHRLKAILGGTVLTIFMQSSSVVNLLVLSLVGAGVVEMYQALAVMMGANLGTTFTGWLMAAFGFHFNIKDYALPLLAVAGLLMVLNNKEKALHHVARFFTGFAFLFLGLAYMKEGMEHLVLNTPLEQFANYPLIFFMLLGVVLTALVQSSSVTMALVLSALFHRGIDLYSAAAIILGAEVGTTLKLALVSVGGLAVKKRVAFGNILFNTASSVGLFFFIRPVVDGIGKLPGLNDPLLQIACFQTMVNLTGIVMFLPFLKPMGRFIEKQFKEASSMEYLNRISIENTALAMEAVEKENIHLFAHTIYYMRGLFEFHTALEDIQTYPYTSKFPDGVRYEHVKKLYGEVHGYSVRIRQQELTNEELLHMEALLTSMRNLMYAAKSLRDIEKDILQLQRSSNDIKYQYYLQCTRESEQFYAGAIRILNVSDKKDIFPLLKQLHAAVQESYNTGIMNLYEDHRAAGVNAAELATLVNVHREMITAFKSILFALKMTFLSGREAEYFDELPGFIH
jgi:phosphate:Na+ symporter